jgi:hypothetical protein
MFTPVDPGFVKPDNYHPFWLSIFICPLSFLFKIAYILTADSHKGIRRSCVHGTTSVDAAVPSLNAAIQDVKEQAIPRGIINSKSKFPHWYSSS